MLKSLSSALLCSALLPGVSFNAVAQTQPPDDAWPQTDQQGPPPGPPRWGAGVAAVVSDSPYAGEGTRVVPIPLLSFQGEKFRFQGITASWSLLSGEKYEFAAIAKLRFDGFKVKDLGRAELARNGVDYRLLEDRDMGVDVGLGGKWFGRAGELEVELIADATDTSGGQEASFQYGYPLAWGKGTFSPTIGATWMSKDLANYYFGTLDEEVARGVVDYKPGASTITHVGFTYLRPLGEKWALMGIARYSQLPDEIQDSPLVEADTSGTSSLFLGISRGF